MCFKNFDKLSVMVFLMLVYVVFVLVGNGVLNGGGGGGDG